jgi:hypothetical protein
MCTLNTKPLLKVDLKKKAAKKNMVAKEAAAIRINIDKF